MKNKNKFILKNTPKNEPINMSHFPPKNNEIEYLRITNKHIPRKGELCQSMGEKFILLSDPILVENDFINKQPTLPLSAIHIHYNVFDIRMVKVKWIWLGGFDKRTIENIFHDLNIPLVYKHRAPIPF